jgi:hypothetical protein
MIICSISPDAKPPSGGFFVDLTEAQRRRDQQSSATKKARQLRADGLSLTTMVAEGLEPSTSRM